MRRFLIAACLLFGFSGSAKAADEFACGTDCGAECFENSASQTAQIRQMNCRMSCESDQQVKGCFSEAQQTHPHAHGHAESSESERRERERRRESERARLKGK